MTSVRCAVEKCPNTDNDASNTDRGISFFTVPLQKELLDNWIQLTAFEWKPGMKVCSDHFSSNDLVVIGKRKILKRGAVPTITPAEYLGELTFKLFSIRTYYYFVTIKVIHT